MVYAPRKSSSGGGKGGRSCGGSGWEVAPVAPQEHATPNWAESGKSSRGSPRGMASAPTAATAATFPVSTPPLDSNSFLSFAFLRNYDLLDFDQFFPSSDSSRLLIPCFHSFPSTFDPSSRSCLAPPTPAVPPHTSFPRRARHFAQHERYGQRPCFAAKSGSLRVVTSELTMT